MCFIGERVKMSNDKDAFIETISKICEFYKDCKNDNSVKLSRDFCLRCLAVTVSSDLDEIQENLKTARFDAYDLIKYIDKMMKNG